MQNLSIPPPTHTHTEWERERERDLRTPTRTYTHRESRTRSRLRWCRTFEEDNLGYFSSRGRLIFQNCTRPLLLQLVRSVTPKAVVTYVRVWSWATSWRNTMDRHFQHAILAAELCVLYTRNNITFVVTMFSTIIFYTLTFTPFIYHTTINSDFSTKSGIKFMLSVPNWLVWLYSHEQTRVSVSALLFPLSLSLSQTLFGFFSLSVLQSQATQHYANIVTS